MIYKEKIFLTADELLYVGITYVQYEATFIANKSMYDIYYCEFADETEGTLIIKDFDDNTIKNNDYIDIYVVSDSTGAVLLDKIGKTMENLINESDNIIRLNHDEVQLIMEKL